MEQPYLELQSVETHDYAYPKGLRHTEKESNLLLIYYISSSCGVVQNTLLTSKSSFLMLATTLPTGEAW